MAQGTPARGEKTAVWRILAAVVIPFLHLVGRYRIQHLERIPTEGAFVFSANHYSNFDPLVTAYAVWRAGRVPRFLAKASLFRVPVLGAALRATGQIPVQRAGAPRTADSPTSATSLAAAERLVDDGLAVIVYPEGTLTREPDLWPMRGKTGAVRIALEQGVPLIPAASWGVQRILARYGRFSPFPRKDVDILVGEPVDLSPWRNVPMTPAVLEAATEAVMVAITDLLAQLRGETPPSGRWNPAEHGQSETGRLAP
jgi:1-acyl-sn-glycerol-3-phosphate acyltransferase